jgi:hypothetical protein
MTTEEVMLIPMRADQHGMNVPSERKWNDDLHTISIKEKKQVGRSIHRHDPFRKFH